VCSPAAVKRYTGAYSVLPLSPGFSSSPTTVPCTPSRVARFVRFKTIAFHPRNVKRAPAPAKMSTST